MSCHNLTRSPVSVTLNQPHLSFPVLNANVSQVTRHCDTDLQTTHTQSNRWQNLTWQAVLHHQAEGTNCSEGESKVLYNQ